MTPNVQRWVKIETQGTVLLNTEKDIFRRKRTVKRLSGTEKDFINMFYNLHKTFDTEKKLTLKVDIKY